MTPVLRDAVPGDERLVARVVGWVAEAEGLAAKHTATEHHYTRLLFGPRAMLYGLLMERDTHLLGGALWGFTAGTFSGAPGLFVEDVAIDPAQRGAGLGRTLFAALAQRARAEGCGYVEWRVRNDNTPALRFYAAIGAKPERQTTYMRLDGATLDALTS